MSNFIYVRDDIQNIDGIADLAGLKDTYLEILKTIAVGQADIPDESHDPHYRLAVPNDRPILKDILQKAIASISEESDYLLPTYQNFILKVIPVKIPGSLDSSVIESPLLFSIFSSPAVSRPTTRLIALFGLML